MKPKTDKGANRWHDPTYGKTERANVERKGEKHSNVKKRPNMQNQSTELKGHCHSMFYFKVFSLILTLPVP